MLDLLLDPNIAYLLLWAGISLAVLAVLSPGTIVLELSALVILIAAGVSILFIPVNFWALGIIAVGVVFFVLAIRYPKRWFFLVVSIASLIIGSIFLFQGESMWEPAVNPFLAVIVSGLSVVFFWFVTGRILEARRARPTHDLESLIGIIGVAKTDVHREGSVQIGSELWSAKSDEPIKMGARVKVVERVGFILKVEALE
jgi:membrane-bound serine protease (ClpP class)